MAQLESVLVLRYKPKKFFPTTSGPPDLFQAKTPARSKSRAENVIRHGAPMIIHKGKIQRTPGPFPQSARRTCQRYSNIVAKYDSTNDISAKKHASVNLKEAVPGTGDAMGDKPVVLNIRPTARSATNLLSRIAQGLLKISTSKQASSTRNVQNYWSLFIRL